MFYIKFFYVTLVLQSDFLTLKYDVFGYKTAIDVGEEEGIIIIKRKTVPFSQRQLFCSGCFYLFCCSAILSLVLGTDSSLPFACRRAEFFFTFFL